jgi:hypothetical protein
MSLWRRALFMTGVTSAMEEGGEEVDALAKDPAKLTEWINTKVLYQGGMFWSPVIWMGYMLLIELSGSLPHPTPPHPTS